MASRPIAMHEVCPFDVMSNGHFSLNSSNGNGNHCKYFRLPSSCVRSCLPSSSSVCPLAALPFHSLFPFAWHGSHFKKKIVDAIKWRRFATCMQITLAHSTQIKFAASCSTQHAQTSHFYPPFVRPPCLVVATATTTSQSQGISAQRSCDDPR